MNCLVCWDLFEGPRKRILISTKSGCQQLDFKPHNFHVFVPSSTFGDAHCGNSQAQHEVYQVWCRMPGLHVPWVPRIIPVPLRVSQDVSQLQLEQPFGKITLRDMLPLLPADGTVRFAREYSSWAQESQEFVVPAEMVMPKLRRRRLRMRCRGKSRTMTTDKNQQ